MDHGKDEKRKAHPKEKANIFSLLTFFYTRKFFGKALKNDLQEKDLYSVLDSCNSKSLGDQVELAWKKIGSGGKKPSIALLLWTCFGIRFMILGLILVTWKVMYTIVEPYSMSQLIGYFKEGQTEISRQDAYYYGSILVGMSIAQFLFLHNWILCMQTLAIQIRTGLSSLIYRKALKLTPSAMANVNFGNIVTLMTKDVATFERASWIINDFWICTTQALVTCYLLFFKIGWVAFMGIACMLLLIPIQLFLGKLIGLMWLNVGAKMDERLQVTQETLSSIKIIKMYTWEKYFYDLVTLARKNEVDSMLKGNYLKYALLLVGVLGSKVSFYILIRNLWIHENASPELIFYIVACYKNLKWSMEYLIPTSLAQASVLYASAKRINLLLQAEEMKKAEGSGSDEITSEPKVELKGVMVKIKDMIILQDVSLSLSAGLTLVTGNVGSGKSSLVKTILQDYPKDAGGHLVTYGRISYASQDPWLFPSSVKNNILFGEKFDPERYEEVINVCSLKFDLDCLDNGDETIVADRGINLSKGQQARINLARAVYKQSEIYLLDDSLTALDAHVQDFIFEKCIKGFLKGKLVVLVTQRHHHLMEADTVVIMSNGTIESTGQPTKQLIEQVKQAMSEDNEIDEVKNDYEVIQNEKLEVPDKDTQPTEQHTLIEERNKKIYHEENKQGSVKFGVYNKYIQFGGGYFVFLGIIVAFTAAQYTESYSDKLLSSWVDYTPKLLICQELLNASTNASECAGIEKDSTFTFNLFSLMLIISVALQIIRTYCLLNFARVASFCIHKAMTHSIINAVMYFFDSHFIGNIINRFSQDLNNLDEVVPSVLRECFGILFTIGGIVFILAMINWRFFLAAIIFGIIIVVLKKLYIPAGRSLKRLESSTRSPIMGHLNASMEGLTTIRAFKQQRILKDEFDRHQDLFTSAHYTLHCSNRALDFAMDFLSTSLITIVISRFMFFNSGESAGEVGLAITQVFILAGQVQWGIRQWAELENQMTGMERVMEYTEIKPENGSGQSPQDWPKHGAVQFKKVSLKYRNTHEAVLKDLNIEVKAGEKVGIVGRTGSGKSSIISTLFRLYDIEGSIDIDGVDIKTVSLTQLRKSIAIIPQDPVLFRGTIRSNIDPLNMFKDEQIWEAIGKVKIKDMIPSLDMPIKESATNFSSGQRQLVCLARAIIRKNKIVVLDEATANMDSETEALLNNTIKEIFKNCTVFTIAHRLHSIIECDKVLVLDRGNVLEYDHPKTLLKNREGSFSKMVQQSDLHVDE
ncbi:unnamed protein product [Brassicogethes aeneus]|uniref:Multidrug resistance-associated protein lethal(2)03659 n=1 Tax=Brassicogethes aeneus TaxID=1431903 RepID=A0A9P0B2X3_BRAAE|nr:unnamed protein product [Brassicogethes aeneus]